MTVLYLLIPLALILATLALLAFIKATKQGQWDDLETPAHRMLYDEEIAKAPADRAAPLNSEGPPLDGPPNHQRIT